MYGGRRCEQNGLYTEYQLAEQMYVVGLLTQWQCMLMECIEVQKMVKQPVLKRNFGRNDEHIFQPV
jgi:hypothetical protein